MNKPEVTYYGQTKTPQTNARREDYQGLTLWYSYRSIIAFREANKPRVVIENIWNTTTGKHLNWIDGGDKNARLEYHEFQNQLKAAMERAGLDYREAV